MHPKTTLVGALVATILLVFSACGGGSEPADDSPPAANETAEDALRVALITPGDINDLSFNQAAYEGLKKLEDEGLIEFAYTERVPEDANSVTQVLNRYAQEDYELIIANSFGYGDPTFAAAEQYPDIYFAWQGAPGEFPPNVAIFVPPIWEASYLAGILAGGVSESGTFGGVAGFDIPLCHALLVAFEEGMKEVRDEVKPLVTFTGDWVDVEKGKQASSAQAAQGADVLVACGEGPALGLIDVAKERDLTAVGFVADQSALAPEHILTSMVWDESIAFADMVQDIKDGTWKQEYAQGVADGAIQAPINEQYQGDIPEDAVAKYDEVLEAIESGDFEVPYVPE